VMIPRGSVDCVTFRQF